MNENLRDFEIVFSDDEVIHKSINDDVCILGDPIHENKQDLIDKYENSNSGYLNYESLNSAGNYILVDARAGLKLITSLGYCGGYIVENSSEIIITTLLSRALKHTEEFKIDKNRLLHFITTSSPTASGMYNRSPFESMFENITRLPPGCSVTLQKNQYKLESYLEYNKQPTSFTDSLDAVVSEFENKNVVLAFSGGVDSTAVACALKKQNVDFRGLTFNRGPGRDSKTVQKSKNISSFLDFECEVIDVPVPDTTSKQADHIESCLQEDLIIYNNTRMGSNEYNYTEEEIAISGVHMDALAEINMKDRYNKTKSKKYYFSSPIEYLKHIMNYHFVDAIFTEEFLQNSHLQKLYFNIAPIIYPNLAKTYKRFSNKDGNNITIFEQPSLSPNKNPNLNTMFMGLLASRYTNYFIKNIQSPLISHLSGFDENYDDSYFAEEISYFDRIDPTGVAPKSSALTRLMYYFDIQNNNKIPNSVSKTPHLPVEYPICWGPMLSYFMNKKRHIHNASNEKREVYNYVEDVTGVSYENMKGNINNNNSWFTTESVVLNRNYSLFTKEDSHILNHFPEDRFLSSIYNVIRNRIREDDYKNIYDYRTCLRVLNLELLLDNAHSERSANE